jgi:DNA replication protein DnaC
LVIDDLGAEKSSEWAREILYLIIDKRYSDLLPTIITSNLSPKELAEKLDDRLVSRLMEDAIVIKIDGKDHRVKY